MGIFLKGLCVSDARSLRHDRTGVQSCPEAMSTVNRGKGYASCWILFSLGRSCAQIVQLSSTLSLHRSRPGALRMHGIHVFPWVQAFEFASPELRADSQANWWDNGCSRGGHRSSSVGGSGGGGGRRLINASTRLVFLWFFNIPSAFRLVICWRMRVHPSVSQLIALSGHPSCSPPAAFNTWVAGVWWGAAASVLEL